MSPEHKTSSDNSQAEGVSPWSEKAQTDRLEANRPTVEDPVMFDFDHATEMVGFSQVPGENLRGVKTGYFYNDEGVKINIIELTAKSREVSGWDKDVMMVPESAINKLVDNTERSTSVSVNEDLGDLTLGAVDIVRPKSDEYGVDESFQRLSRSELRELRRKARETFNGDDSGSESFEPTTESLVETKETVSNYDKLFDENYVAPGVEVAANRFESDDDRMTRERREADARDSVSKAYLASKGTEK